MTITGIGVNNASAFEAVLPEVGQLCQREELFCMGAIEDGEPAGVLVGAMADGTAEVRRLYVAEDKRRRGIGTALLQNYIDYMDSVGALAYFADFPVDEDPLFNMGAQEFFERNAFIVMDGEEYISIPLKDIYATDFSVKLVAKAPDPDVVGLEDLRDREARGVEDFLQAAGIDPLDYEELDLDKSLSCVAFDDNRRINGALIAGFADDEIVVYFMNSEGGSNVVMRLLQYVFRAVRRTHRMKMVSFVAETESVERLALKLVGDPEKLVRAVHSRHAVFFFR